MKKIAAVLLLLGIVLAGIALGIGVMARDDQELRTLAAQNGLTVDPQYAEQLAAAPGAALLSGKADLLLKAYPYVSLLTRAGVCAAAVGLLILVLALILKPILCLAALALIAVFLYFGAQGNLGPAVADFLTAVFEQAQALLSQLLGQVQGVQVTLPITLPTI